MRACVGPAPGRHALAPMPSDVMHARTIGTEAARGMVPSLRAHGAFEQSHEDAMRLDEPVAQRLPDGFGFRMNVQLVVDAADVRPHGIDAEAEGIGRSLITMAVG